MLAALVELMSVTESQRHHGARHVPKSLGNGFGKMERVRLTDVESFRTGDDGEAIGKIECPDEAPSESFVFIITDGEQVAGLVNLSTTATTPG